MINSHWAWPCGLSLALTAGCAPAEPQSPPAARPGQPVAAPQQPAAPAAAPSAASPQAGSPAAPVSSRPSAKPSPPQTAPGETRRAAPGLSGRGSRYGGDPVTAPLSARFRIEERLELLQVTQALNLFRAQEGRLPKSHEEFMEKIVQANNITLPPLPPGDTYFYDPEQGQLMVRKAR